MALAAAEAELTELDRVTGDGDLGTSMARAARAVKDSLASYPLEDVPATLKAIGHILRRELGGSSGPLYAVLFLRCGSVLQGCGLNWAAAVGRSARVRAAEAISELGGAKPGDRTMLDALDPFVKTLQQAVGSNATSATVLAALQAADRGAEATAQMKPRLGRSSYLGDRVLGYPDPGAKAIAVWLRAACEAIFPRF